MKNVNLFSKYPLASYFVLTFLLSWSGVITVSFFTGMPAPGDVFARIAPFAMIPLVIGPALISIVLTGFIQGKSGLKHLFSLIIRWRHHPGLYLFALLVFPVTAVVTLLILSQFSSDFLPKILTAENKSALLITAIGVGIFLTLLEEIGWTGFALTLLRKKFGVLSSGLILGAIWGAWHFLPVFYGCGNHEGKLSWELFYPGLFFHYAGLIPIRILLVWLYEKTESILVPWILHATGTASLFFVFNLSVPGTPLFVYYIVLAVILWLLSAAVLNIKKRLPAHG